MAVIADVLVGELVQQLLGAVLEVKVKAVKLRPILEMLQNTLESFGPDAVKILELQRNQGRVSETNEMIELLKTGKKLVLDYGKYQLSWNCIPKEAHYRERLEELDGSISRFFQLGMQAKIARTVLDIEMRVDELREVLRNAADVVGYLESVTVPSRPEFTVGLDVPLNELKRKLLQEEFTVLTVTGPPGSGKTTLATMFCWDDQARGKFSENIFYVTFGKIPMPYSRIVKRLYLHNGYDVLEFQSDEDAVNQLEILLKEIGKKGPILLVLDDVCPGSESLIGNFVFQIPNYKILVTSRSAITRFGSLQVLEPLGEKDATMLFRYSASLNQSSSSIPNYVVKKIVRGCQGSPLTLTMTGRSLVDQELMVWRTMAKDLSKGHRNQDSENNVLTHLQERMAIECYKDLGLFPKDQRIRAAVLVDLWAELYSQDDDTAMKKIHELVNQKLANIIVTRKVAREIIDYNYNYVTQQGGVREVGISLNSQEPEEKRNRLIIEINGNKLPPWLNVDKEYPIAARILSISFDETFPSKCNLQPTEAEALVLNLRQKKCMLPMFMKKMNKLKVLTIIKYDFYPAELKNVELLDHLPNLRRLWLENVYVPFFSNTSVQLRNLQKCYFFMCNVNKAFRFCTAQVSDVLPNLVEMDFDYCTMEELPVVLSNCRLLKKLRITNCHQLSALPEGIGNLVNLELLSLSSCPDLVKLSDSITSLESLKFLDISDCISLTKLPEDMGKLSNLEKLNVRGCSRLTELPASTWDLGNLKHVVCDEKMADQFKQNLSDLQLHVAQADFNLDFLNNLRS